MLLSTVVLVVLEVPMAVEVVEVVSVFVTGELDVVVVSRAVTFVAIDAFDVMEADGTVPTRPEKSLKMRR